MKIENQFNYLKEIILTLAGHSVDFIICGGVALVLHGIERMTMDIDIALDMHENNIKKFLDAMKELNMVPRVPVPAESLMDPQIRADMVSGKNALVFTFINIKNPYRQIDIFLSDNMTYDSLKNDISTIQIDAVKIKLVSKEKLLEMKKSVIPKRDKDEFDIMALEKMINK